MHIRNLFLAVCVSLPILAAAVAPVAAEPTTPSEFIESLAGRAIEALKANATREDRETRFHALFRDYFAVDAIAKWTLGRYWNQATEAQRDEYLKLFENLIVATYVERFKDYQGEQVRVVKAASAGEDDVLVQSEIIRPEGGEPVSVGWRVRVHEGKFKIVDVLAEGVSMSQAQRSEFASVIRRNGGDLDALLAELRKGPAGGRI